jgi:hypothetical protein
MPPPKPPPLPPGPLTLAAARRLGLREHEWRLAGDLRTQGVRSTTRPITTRERAGLFALALPADCAFSHITAAQLWGLPLPRSVEGQEELDVIRATGRGRVERHGCLGHRGGEARTIVTLQGLRVTSLADTWVDLGEVMGRGLDVTDLLVAGDEVANRRPLAPLATTLAGRVRPRHAVALAEALALVRPGVRSPMETRTRLVFHRAGFPEPAVNAALHARDGGWLAEGDLVWREQRVVGEYQGEVHAGIRNRSRDSYRNWLLVDEGWRVLEIFAEDVYDAWRRLRLLERFAHALALDLRTLRIQ